MRDCSQRNRRTRVVAGMGMNGIVVAAGLLLSLVTASDASAPFTFACRADNDLFTVLTEAGERHARFDTPGEAIRRARPGSVLLVLADEYPKAPAPVDAAFYETAKSKRLRGYVEYPAAVPGREMGAPEQAVWERGVVATDTFGPTLPQLALFSPHACHYIPMKAPNPLLVIGRVAGFDSAVYGIPASADPLLFEAQGGDWLIAT